MATDNANTTNTANLRILVTGSRSFVDEKVVTAALRSAVQLLGADTHVDTVTLVHGGARGLDTMAAAAARAIGMNVETHPADWNNHGRRAGYLRNQVMVDLGADACLAFPMHTKQVAAAGGTDVSRGTWMCVDIAVKAGIPVLVVWNKHLFAANAGAGALIEAHNGAGGAPMAIQPC